MKSKTIIYIILALGMAGVVYFFLFAEKPCNGCNRTLSDEEMSLLDKGYNEEEVAQILSSKQFQEGVLTV